MSTTTTNPRMINMIHKKPRKAMIMRENIEKQTRIKIEVEVTI